MKKSEFRNLIREEIKKVLSEAWTKQRIDRELRELSLGAQEFGDIDDSMAYDIARTWIDDNPGIEAAIKKYYNVTDVIGFVANRVA